MRDGGAVASVYAEQGAGQALATTPWRITVLGGFSLSVHGQELALPANCTRLVALLTLHRRGLTRALVADTLWPEASEEHSLASLRSVLWRLRRDTAELVGVLGGALRLDTGAAVDYWAASELAGRLLGPGSSAGTDALDADVIALLSSELLPGWYDNWVSAEADRWQQRRVRALEALAAWTMGRGLVATAQLAGLAAVEAEPLRESAWGALIEADLATANYSEALVHFERYRTVLERELGLRPSARIRALVEDLNVR